jgi:hypothetical protein
MYHLASHGKATRFSNSQKSRAALLAGERKAPSPSEHITLLVRPEVFRENGGFAQRAEANE